jgi:hypothetical protein
MATLKFDGQNHSVEIFDMTGTSRGSWPAYNNIDLAFSKAHYGGMTHLQNGVYRILDTLFPLAHTPDPNGPYGLYGIIRFLYPGHPGVGVHSGRAHAKHIPGPQHATHGCIRTTDVALLAISEVMGKDQLQTITIVHNSAALALHGQSKYGARM